MEGIEIFLMLGVALASVLGGAYLQLKFGILQDKISRKEETDEEVLGVIQNLIHEVAENMLLIESGYDQDNYGNAYHTKTLHRISFDNAVNSKAYTTIDPFLITDLKDYYELINKWNITVEKTHGEDVIKVLKRIYFDQTRLEIKLRKSTEKIMPQLTDQAINNKSRFTGET